MTDKEVMQQALEALRDAIDYTDDEASSPKVTRQCADAIAALESALAQPVQPSFTHDDADRLFGRPGDCDCLVAYGNICSEETEILAVRIEAMKAAAHDLVDRFALAQPVQPTVTCQIYGHVVGACAECNTHNEQDPVAWMTHANDTLPLFHKTLAGALGWGAEPTPLYTKPRNQNER